VLVETELGEILRGDYDFTIELMEKGIRPVWVVVATLKSERRSLERIPIGKTRVFLANNACATLVSRHYVFRFLIAQRTKRFDVFSAIGMDPESFDMHEVATRLTANSPHCICSDFSQYDARLHSMLIWGFFRIVAEYERKLGASDARVKGIEMLCELTTFTDISVLDALVRKMQGNVSGFAGTTELNIWAQVMIFFTCWRLLAPPHMRSFHHFMKNVVFIGYGDDGIQSVSEEAKEFYNLRTIIPVAERYFGVKMTDAGKSASDVKPYVPLDECTFLKRRFVRGLPSGLMPNFWFGQLSWEVIEEMTNWIKADAAPLLQAEVNCQEALRFAAYYSQEKFEDLRQRIRVALGSYGFHPPLFHYAELQDMIVAKMGVV
jgi:hypothetical protein